MSVPCAIVFAGFAHTQLKTRPAPHDGSGIHLEDAELDQAPPLTIEERIDAFLRGLMACYQGLGASASEFFASVSLQLCEVVRFEFEI